MHWRSLPTGSTFERREIAQSTFEKPAMLFAGLFFVSVPIFVAGFVAFLFFF